MKYLLDTNVVSKLYDKTADGHEPVLGRIAALQDEDEVAVSVLTLFELGYGLVNAPDDKKDVVRYKVEQVQDAFQVLPIPPQGFLIFGKLKKALREKRSLTREGAQKHSVDLLLATTCLVDGRTLVTADTVFEDLKSFEPGLMIDNWLAP